MIKLGKIWITYQGVVRLPIVKPFDIDIDVPIMNDDVYKKFEIIPNVKKIISSDLRVDQVSNILYIAFKGHVVAIRNSKKQQDQIPIFVSLSEKTKVLNSVSKNELALKLSRLKLMNTKGKMVPIREVQSEPTIYRKNMKKMITISAECDLVSQLYPLLDAREVMIDKLSQDYNITRLTRMSTYMFDLD